MQATADYLAAAHAASAVARADRRSAALIAAQTRIEARERGLATHRRLAPGAAAPLALRASALAVQTQTRQQTRQRQARVGAQRDTRDALAALGVAGGLAFACALLLIASLVRSMRGPLDELVSATRALSTGERARRITPAGPSELRALAASFNAMGEDLSRAQEQIEAERRRLAVAIASLGDGLLITAEDGVTIRTANPRAAELIPELSPGDRADAAASPLPPLDTALGS